jgi:hypothetical protein
MLQFLSDSYALLFFAADLINKWSSSDATNERLGEFFSRALEVHVSPILARPLVLKDVPP